MSDAQVRRHYVERLADYLADRLMLDPQAILGTTRGTNRASDARHILTYWLREQAWQLDEIGEALHRDHSTVHHAWSKVRARLATDMELREVVRNMPRMAVRMFSEPNLVELYQQLTETLAVAMDLRNRIDAVLSQQDIPQRALRAIS